MRIYISTNLYKPEQLHLIFGLMDKIGDPLLGIELFPEWNSQVFCNEVTRGMERFRRYPNSLHGPYVHTEHSKPEGTEEYARTMDYFRRTLALSRQLKSRYIVYHHNNCRVEPRHRDEMIKNSSRNLVKLRCEAEYSGAKLAVENAGVVSRGNMLFDEAQFISMAERIPDDILLDVGHAHANGWDLHHVMGNLAHKITAYHVHNNDGYEDQHNRIREGTLDIAKFFGWYQHYTPQADIVVEYGQQCAEDPDGIAEDVAYIKQILSK
ncbi:MAG: sugar phosphate isomerase/epimerase [Veillonellales bacterium]